LRYLVGLAIPSASSTQIFSAKLGCNAKALGRKPAAVAKSVNRNVVAAAVSGEVPDMGKRNVMNLLLVGAIGLPATSLVGGFAYFFVPPG
jgi:cytochrome b6-f complex iron-sulfur subunit